MNDIEDGGAHTHPRWLRVAFGPALAGHAIAGVGLYWDIAWHIDVGRDEALLTAPHSLILLGLLLQAGAYCLGLLVAARDGQRLPRALIAAAFSGIAAVAGFPLDELWHRANGVDVTLWSPTHLLMVGGGALSVIPLWLALGEARVRAGDSRHARLAHLSAAIVTLGGLSAFQGEFDFGVPQFQLMYHPVLIVAAGAFLLTAARAVLGRGGALATALGYLAFRGFLMLFVGVAAGRTAPVTALYAGIALCVEFAARIRPPERGLVPFAMLAGAAAGTVGLATEWLWAGLVGRHAWTIGLLPDAVILALLGGLGAALLGAALAAALHERLAPPHRFLLAGAAAMALVALLAPLPRTADSAPQAAISFEPVGSPRGSEARIQVVIGPPDAPYRARWWEVMAWQGGGLRLIPLVAGEGSGVYRSAAPVPVSGDWKVMLRLHRGSDILAAMLRRPADPDRGIEAIEPANAFVTLRKENSSEGGGDPNASGLLEPGVLSVVGLLALAWFWFTVRAAGAARAALAPAAVSQAGRRKLRQG